MLRVQVEDCKSLGKLEFIDWESLRQKTIMITGATGLIGSNLVNALAYNSKTKNLDIEIILPVRNQSAAKKQFDWANVEVIPYSIDSKIEREDSVDYIIHLASPTNSKFFNEQPVDTLLANIEGFNNILNWAVHHPVKKFIGLSSMEVYGFPKIGHKVKENELGSFETMNARNSYPISKIACEALCYGYFVQFGVPTIILRATQTFGPGVDYNDARIFAQLMRCVVEKKDIVLKSGGLTERSYLYTLDAVSAILLGLNKCTPGEAYTVANPETYCSIRKMVEMVANNIADGKIKVAFDLEKDIQKLGYAETLYMDLDIKKIAALGWRPTVNLKEMFERMIRGFNESI